MCIARTGPHCEVALLLSILTAIRPSLTASFAVRQSAGNLLPPDTPAELQDVLLGGVLIVKVALTPPMPRSVCRF